MHPRTLAWKDSVPNQGGLQLVILEHANSGLLCVLRVLTLEPDAAISEVLATYVTHVLAKSVAMQRQEQCCPLTPPPFPPSEHDVTCEVVLASICCYGMKRYL